MRGAPISAFHGRLEKIGRERHAQRLNRIANHPDILPLVAAGRTPPLDFTFTVADESNILLMSQHGGILFGQISPGIYEAHPMVLPEGRGEWALDLGRCALHWMFTRSDAMEIIAPVPEGNVTALAYARSLGLKPAFTTAPKIAIGTRLVPVKAHAITLQDWLPKADGLAARGDWVHHELKRFDLRLTSIEDHEVYRQVGFAFECFLNGQAPKGVVFHGRWARIAGVKPCELISEKPLAIEFAGGTVVFQDHGKFYVVGAEAGAALH